MKPPQLFRSVAPRLGLAVVLGVSLATLARAFDYPRAKKVDQVDTFFGVEVKDPYRWLEKVDDPEVQAWVAAENRITREFLDALPYRKLVIDRLTQLLDYPRHGIPVKRGEWVFFSKNDGLQDQSVVYKQRGMRGKPAVLIDPNTLSKDGTVSLGAMDYTRDGAMLAYGLHESGSDWQVIHVMDVASGRQHSDRLERARFTNLSWLPDNSGFYYSRYPEDQEHFQKLYFHRVGDPQSADRLVYERPEDKDLGISGEVSDDGRFLILHVWKGTASENEIFVQRLDREGAPVEPLFTGFDHAWEFIESAGERLFFITDSEAPRRRIVAVDFSTDDRRVQEVVPQTRDVMRFARLTNGQIAAGYMHNAYHTLRMYGLDGSLLQDVDMPTIGSIGSISGRPSDPELFVSFSSFLFPSQNYRYDFASRKLELFQKAAMDFDADAFTARQIFYESKDGTKVPMFLVHRRGITLDGDNPVLLYGYGGFDISITPRFSTSRLFWLEQGGVLAMPSLRGGGEFGEEWHRAGMLANKQNVFDDFIAAAEWLITNGYTSPDRLAIEGGSNGGLLTAACTVQRPDLYGAVLCRVPVIDMLRYHKFTIGSYWIPEYGDPENPEHFKFLYAYSPLHNVRPGVRYPSMLITTADTDTRVDPAHAKKFAATLQAATAGDDPILLRVETKAGHGAGKPISKRIEEQADLYTFVFDRLGMNVLEHAGKVVETSR